MEIHAGAVPKEIYTTTTRSHLYHQVANGFICVALHLKCYSVPVVISPWEKVTNNQRIRAWFTNTKFNSLLHIFFKSSRREKQNRKTESTVLSEQKKHVMRRQRAETWLEFFLIFCCNVTVRWFRLHSCASGVRLLFGPHPKMGAVTFGCLHIAVSSLQLTVFTSLPPAVG